jgi:2-keto-4-pentenoate hydratase
MRRRRAVLDGGAERVGWKIGRGLVEGEEHLEPGDRIIAGSILHVPVAAGDDVVVDLGELGDVRLTIS